MGSQGCAEASASGCFAEQAWEEGRTHADCGVAVVDRDHVTGTRMSGGPDHCTVSKRRQLTKTGSDRPDSRWGSRTSAATEEGTDKRHTGPANSAQPLPPAVGGRAASPGAARAASPPSLREHCLARSPTTDRLAQHCELWSQTPQHGPVPERFGVRLTSNSRLSSSAVLSSPFALVLLPPRSPRSHLPLSQLHYHPPCAPSPTSTSTRTSRPSPPRVMASVPPRRSQPSLCSLSRPRRASDSSRDLGAWKSCVA
jgi:hypothetical protein